MAAEVEIIEVPNRHSGGRPSSVDCHSIGTLVGHEDGVVCFFSAGNLEMPSAVLGDVGSWGCVEQVAILAAGTGAVVRTARLVLFLALPRLSLLRTQALDTATALIAAHSTSPRGVPSSDTKFCMATGRQLALYDLRLEALEYSAPQPFRIFAVQEAPTALIWHNSRLAVAVGMDYLSVDDETGKALGMDVLAPDEKAIIAPGLADQVLVAPGDATVLVDAGWIEWNEVDAGWERTDGVDGDAAGTMEPLLEPSGRRVWPTRPLAASVAFPCLYAVVRNGDAVEVHVRALHGAEIRAYRRLPAHPPRGAACSLQGIAPRRVRVRLEAPRTRGEFVAVAAAHAPASVLLLTDHGALWHCRCPEAERFASAAADAEGLRLALSTAAHPLGAIVSSAASRITELWRRRIAGRSGSAPHASPFAGRLVASVARRLRAAAESACGEVGAVGPACEEALFEACGAQLRDLFLADHADDDVAFGAGMARAFRQLPPVDPSGGACAALRRMMCSTRPMEELDCLLAASQLAAEEARRDTAAPVGAEDVVSALAAAIVAAGVQRLPSTIARIAAVLSDSLLGAGGYALATARSAVVLISTSEQPHEQPPRPLSAEPPRTVASSLMTRLAVMDLAAASCAPWRPREEPAHIPSVLDVHAASCDTADDRRAWLLLSPGALLVRPCARGVAWGPLDRPFSPQPWVLDLRRVADVRTVVWAGVAETGLAVQTSSGHALIWGNLVDAQAFCDRIVARIRSLGLELAGGPRMGHGGREAAPP